MPPKTQSTNTWGLVMSRGKHTYVSRLNREAYTLIIHRLLGSDDHSLSGELRLARAVVAQTIHDWVCGSGSVRRAAGIYIKYQAGWLHWCEAVDVNPIYAAELISKCGYPIDGLNPNNRRGHCASV